LAGKTLKKMFNLIPERDYIGYYNPGNAKMAKLAFHEALNIDAKNANARNNLRQISQN